VSDPATHASRLIGMPVTAVTDDGSPRGAMTFALWEPATVDGHRRSATTEAAEILAELVLDGVQAVAFARSRAGAESLATNARRRVEHDDPARAEGVAAYRGGYLPQDRREIERGLRDGTVRGLAATNALELGIDVGKLDAVISVGVVDDLGDHPFSRFDQHGHNEAFVRHHDKRAGRRVDEVPAIAREVPRSLQQLRSKEISKRP